MASLTCTHCGATLKTKTAIDPGKRVKCPKCGKTFIVGKEESAPPDNPFGDIDPRPVPRRAKKSNALLFVLLASVLGLCCCCTVVPGAGWFFRESLGFEEAFKIVKEVSKDPKKPVTDTDAKKDDDKTVRVTAEQLAMEMDKDNVSFKDKYLGKEVIVTGIVEDAIHQNPKQTTVKLQTPTRMRIYANFEPPDTISVRRGDSIEFRIRLEKYLIMENDFRVPAKLGAK